MRALERGTVLDVALAVLCGVAAGQLTADVTAATPRGPAVAATVVAVVHGSAVGLRRRAPAVMVGVLLGTATVYAGLGVPVAFLGPAVLVAAYAVASGWPRPTALRVLALVEGALVVLLLLGPGSFGADTAVLYAALVGGAWFLGDVVRRWRAMAEENGRRAAELERARTELAAHAVVAERVRIARELHDVVAHSMSVVAMHAGAGRLAVGVDPVAERAALEVIEETTRDALAEMRRLVTVLREDPGGGTDTGPAPGLPALPALVSAIAGAGAAVDVRTEGDLAAVPAGVSLAGYRIVQEALTNVVRHAGPVRVRVSVRVGGGALGIEVENDPPTGPAVGSPGGGHGLRGVRERVGLYGGTVVAGPTRPGGWRVAASLPCREPS